MTTEVSTDMATPACPPPDVLARLATGELDDADEPIVAHASECLHCRSHLDAQHEMRSLAARLPAPTLSRSRRAALAAEVMARADRLDVAAPSTSEHAADADDADIAATLAELRPRRRRTIAIALSGIAAAAAVTLAIVSSQRDAEPPKLATVPAPPAPAPTPTTPPTPAPPSERVVVEESVPAPAAVSGAKADFAWDRDRRDTVQLRDGELAVNSVDTRAVQIVAGETRVDVARARAAVKAHRGVIQTVTVIAGSVEVIEQGRRHIIEAGMTWEAPPPKPAASSASPASSSASSASTSAAKAHAAGALPDAKSTAARASLDAFRDGWTALRENRHRDAIAAFDRATDPVVLEDAAYWAAIAAERAGDKADATARFTAFATKFPTSPRIPDAQLAIERLQR